MAPRCLREGKWSREDFSATLVGTKCPRPKPPSPLSSRAGSRCPFPFPRADPELELGMLQSAVSPSLGPGTIPHGTPCPRHGQEGRRTVWGGRRNKYRFRILLKSPRSDANKNRPELYKQKPEYPQAASQKQISSNSASEEKEMFTKGGQHTLSAALGHF